MLSSKPTRVPVCYSWPTVTRSPQLPWTKPFSPPLPRNGSACMWNTRLLFRERLLAGRDAQLERAVVTSDVFGDALKRMRLLAIHDCHFVEIQAADPHLVAAKVAGFDTAVFGIEDVAVHPLLFELPDQNLLVATTKFSQFVTARYAPQDAIQVIWSMVLAWLQPGKQVPRLDWTPTVRPTYSRDAPLPADAARRAVVRGIDWHTNARLLMHASWKDEYEKGRREGRIPSANPVGPAPDPQWPAGDGQHGLLEGVSSRVQYDGRQPVRWWLRTDSIGESALAFALRSRLDGDPRSGRIAENLVDWVYLTSGLFQSDPAQADFGLLHWAPDNTSLYGDNDVKAILGCIGTAALRETDRWDEPLLQNILGNYRTTGSYGFRGSALNDSQLLSRGWQHYWRSRTLHFAPHYEAWIWATYLWLYDKTGYEPLLARTRSAIGRMMAAYPGQWRWTNGIQQERGRMLLTLSWLIRVDDRPEHRAWLQRLADDMRNCQDATGAIREELGPAGHGTLRPPESNAEYGVNEASLIQNNGDPVADLLYTCNFALLGLHEAQAATGLAQYQEMADRLAEFLVRVQILSDEHPELDGGWFRAFDFHRWDYWGSNADSGWGAWSIEAGWTQAWIPTVLAMRELNVNLWELSKNSRVVRHWETTRKRMLPDAALVDLSSMRVVHAALGKPVTLTTPPDARYFGGGAAGLTDGDVGKADHSGLEWLGFEGPDLDATINLGAPTPLTRLTANFLQSTTVGIFLPTQVEFAVSDDSRSFRTVAIIKPDVSDQASGPSIHRVSTDALEVTARFVRVRTRNMGVIPPWHSAAGRKAWLFVDEISVHSRGE